MRRLPSIAVILAVTAFLAAGFGCTATDAPSTSDPGNEAGRGGPAAGADAAACAANRRTISAAAQQHYAVAGSCPPSIQSLVPGYLQGLPACPDGGTYTLQGNSAACSVHGT